jgi:hypothetical protein
MIKKLIRKLLNKLRKIKRIEQILYRINGIIEAEKFLKVTEHILGFHGDQYLLNLVNFLLLESKYFIETGTRRGVTLKYVADSYKHLKLFSCEPFKEYFSIAESKLKGYHNCKIYNETSQSFIPKILDTHDLDEKLSFFYLDAHGEGFKWPLKQEIEHITHRLTKAIILIDDFKVPNNPQFIYDIYDGQECRMSFIKDNLYSKRDYMFIYPNYKIKTSNYPHFAGYIFILMGLNIEEINIPNQLFENYILL